MSSIYTKSNYKIYCQGCNSNINRGDLITQVVEDKGMILRPVITKYGFYTPFTGARWVHKDCEIIEWDDELGYISLWTLWSADKHTESYCEN